MNFQRIKAIVLRHLYNAKHDLHKAFDSFYWPAMDIILWGLTSQYIQRSANQLSNIVIILLSALIFWQVVWRGQYEITVSLLEEMWTQNLINLVASPLTINEWLAGLFLLGFLKMIPTILIAGFLAWIMYTVNILTFGWMLIPFFASLLMVGWWIGVIVAGLLIQFGRQFSAIAWSGVYLLAPFSAIYYPVSSLPNWAQKISRVLPSAYIFEGMRKTISTGQIPLANLLISFILNLIYLVLAVIFFKLSFQKSKQKGLERLT